jgi:hypothetical protein
MCYVQCYVSLVTKLISMQRVAIFWPLKQDENNKHESRGMASQDVCIQTHGVLHCSEQPLLMPGNVIVNGKAVILQLFNRPGVD